MITFKIIHSTEPAVGKRIASHYGQPTQVEQVDMGRTVPWIGPASDVDLMAALEIAHRRALAPDEIGHLLSGRTASGMPVAGITKRTPSRGLASALDLSTDAMPSADVLRGLNDILPASLEDRSDARAALVRRLFAKYGVPRNRRASQDELELMGRGLRASGKPMKQGKFLRSLGAPSARPVAAVDYTIAGDKGFSLGWALGTAAERAIFEAIHREVVIETIGDVCRHVCHSRRGNGGKAGKVPGAGAWFAFTHVTARSTGLDSGMRPTGSGRLAGDPHVHTHAVLMNRIRCEDGRMSTCDLGELRNGGVMLLGALVHARIATKLRQEGVEVELDETGTYAKLSKIPDALRELFCERTRRGEEVADQLGPDARGSRRTALVKRTVQGDYRAARRDDVANHAAWRTLAAPFLPLNLIDPDRSVSPTADPSRLERGAVICAELLNRDLVARRAALEAGREPGPPLDPDLAAARSLIAVGFVDFTDVSAVRVKALAAITAAEAKEDPEVIERPSTRQKIAGAKLVPGGVDEVLQVAAETWIAKRSANDPKRDGAVAVVPIVVTKDEVQANLVTAEIRRRLRAARDMVGDDFAVPVRSASGIGSIMLAEGDMVAFGKHINLSGEKRRGRAVSAGAPVTIVGVDEDAIVFRLRDGRDQTVPWSILRDAATGTIAVTHSYAMPYASTAIGTRPWIVAATAGSSNAPIPRAVDHAVYSRTIEGVAHKGSDDEVLADILNGLGDPSMHAAADGRRRPVIAELRKESERLIRRSFLRLERADVSNVRGNAALAHAGVVDVLKNIAHSMVSLVAAIGSKKTARRSDDVPSRSIALAKPLVRKGLERGAALTLGTVRGIGAESRAALDRSMTRLEQANPRAVAAVASAAASIHVSHLQQVVTAFSAVIGRRKSVTSQRSSVRPGRYGDAPAPSPRPARSAKPPSGRKGSSSPVIDPIDEGHLVGMISPSFVTASRLRLQVHVPAARKTAPISAESRNTLDRCLARLDEVKTAAVVAVAATAPDVKRMMQVVNALSVVVARHKTSVWARSRMRHGQNIMASAADRRPVSRDTTGIISRIVTPQVIGSVDEGLLSGIIRPSVVRSPRPPVPRPVEEKPKKRTPEPNIFAKAGLVSKIQHEDGKPHTASSPVTTMASKHEPSSRASTAQTELRKIAFGLQKPIPSTEPRHAMAGDDAAPAKQHKKPELKKSSQVTGRVVVEGPTLAVGTQFSAADAIAGKGPLDQDGQTSRSRHASGLSDTKQKGSAAATIRKVRKPFCGKKRKGGSDFGL